MAPSAAEVPSQSRTPHLAVHRTHFFCAPRNRAGRAARPRLALPLLPPLSLSLLLVVRRTPGRKAVGGTPLRVPTGPCIGVKVGRCSMPEESLRPSSHEAMLVFKRTCSPNTRFVCTVWHLLGAHCRRDTHFLSVGWYRSPARSSSPQTRLQ